jgi:hypothetical protein
MTACLDRAHHRRRSGRADAYALSQLEGYRLV